MFKQNLSILENIFVNYSKFNLQNSPSTIISRRRAANEGLRAIKSFIVHKKASNFN